MNVWHCVFSFSINNSSAKNYHTAYGALHIIYDLFGFHSFFFYYHCFPFLADSILKREKRLRARRVHFENVTVYYFSRRQGFTSVPSQGGSTLGMSNRHSCVRQYSLGEFALEQERIHRDMLKDHLKEEKFNSIKLKVKAFYGSIKNKTIQSINACNILFSRQKSLVWGFKAICCCI